MSIDIQVDYDGSDGAEYRRLWLEEWAKQDRSDRRMLILDIFETLVVDVLYYDRQDDDETVPGVIEWSVAHGDVSVEELIVLFGEKLASHLL